VREWVRDGDRQKGGEYNLLFLLLLWFHYDLLKYCLFMIGQGSFDWYSSYWSVHVLCCYETRLRWWFPLALSICLKKKKKNNTKQIKRTIKKFTFY
jgi:hypothetical protein